jgi:hypothetical protein
MSELEQQLYAACETGMAMRDAQSAYFKGRNGPTRMDLLRAAKVAESKFDTAVAAAVRAARQMESAGR